MFRLLLCLVAVLVVVTPIYGQTGATPPDMDPLPDLIVPAEAPPAGPAEPAAAARAAVKSHARINRQVIGEMAPGRRFGFTPPGATQRQFLVERAVDHANGDRTLVGRLIDGEIERRAIVTSGAAGTLGRVDTPEGRFLLHGSGDAIELIDRRASGRRVAPQAGDDARRPPRADRLQANGETGAETGQDAAAPAAAYAIPAGNSVIDLLVVTSPKMSTRYPGGLLQTRINNLVEIANQAYVNSRIAITLRVVHQQQVAYGDAQSLNQALNDLTNGTGGLAAVTGLRAQHGADLVTLVRPFDSVVDSGCGMAWILDHTGTPASFNRAHAMSVVSDGDDLQPSSRYYCPETSLAHEIGHNLGSAHDRAHASVAGTYSYSYGYGIDNVFGTIMSYLDPGVELFSNPRISTCAGRPCGVAIGTAGEADNATSMNNTRTLVASFNAAVVPASSGLNDLLIDFGPPHGIWLRRNDSQWLAVHGLPPNQMSAGDLDKDGRSDVLIDFGSPYGILSWRNGLSWSQVHGSSASQIVATDLDNNGLSEFVINFGSPAGVWVWRNGSDWIKLHSLAPRQIVSASLDADPRRDLIVDFGAPHGVYLYLNGGNWVPLHGASAKDIVAGDLDGNGIDEIVIDFGAPHGLWIRLNQNSWVKLHGFSAQHMAVGNFDADPRKDLAVDFGSPHGIWLWKNHANWQAVHGLVSESLSVADLDRNGIDDLIIDFGSQYGLWAWRNGANWTQLHGSSPRAVLGVDTDGQ